MVQRKSASQILKKRARPAEGIDARLIIKYSILAAVILLLSGAITSVIVYFYLSKDLPKISSLTDYHPSIITEVYSDDNRKIAELYHERRVVVPLSEMPVMLIEAFIASEDARFYKHQGVDFFSIVRAFIKNLEAGEIVQGGQHNYTAGH